ncbi:TlpA disulfide reductase family protein [Pedobacter frigoris]|uniref:TlpA family protein disulfide reductase n=1 Tax=Pedobacter frigoris TaxID=2571272 RepID=UPI00292ED978|nr:TlpA disulfide reductase family protein [Pedobacter frigoris]
MMATNRSKVEGVVMGMFKRPFKVLTGILIQLIIPIIAVAQSKYYPEIGKSVPPFEFTKFEGPVKRELSNNGLKGRFVILDFWSTGCGACIASMPKMYSLSEKFKDKVDIILVGMEEKQRSISGLYKVIKEKNNLDLISAYDSLYFHKFVHSTVPYLVWIDPQGIVKAITTNVEATEENLINFISGSSFAFKDVSFAALGNKTFTIDYHNPLLEDGNGGLNPKQLFRSVLYKWELEMGNGRYSDVDQFLRLYSKNRYQTTRANLFLLYRLAYFGTGSYLANDISPKVVLKTRDTSMFSFSYSGNGKGLYNYSVEVPIEEASTDRIMRVMQEDLHKYFGFKVKIIDLETPYLALVVTDKKKVAKIIGKNGNEDSNWGPELRKAILFNFPVEQLKVYIGKYLPDKNVIYDETNLQGYINISMPGKQLTELATLRASLKKIGLDLKPSHRTMKTLVIEDDSN